jgi:hypothetical protein
MNAHVMGDAVMPSSHSSNAVRATALRPEDTHQSCRREILRLTTENARLSDELARIRARHEDLTRSAEIWINLYETYVALAKRSAARSAAVSMEQLLNER